MSTRVWLGGAVDIAQVDEVGVGGTWAADETLTLTINGKDLIVTVGAATATASVASAVVAAVNASGKTDGLEGTETRNVGGQEIPEFTELTASASGSSIVLEADTNGIPFTLSASETSAAGTVSASTTVTCNGKNFFDNADNWTGGAVPVSGDVIVFQNSDVDCLYNLSQTAVTNVTMQIDASFTGRIGLPKNNANGYDEYRERHLGLKFSSSARSVVIGEGPGSGSSRLNINADTSDPKVVIISTGTAESGAKAAVDFIGGNTATDISIRQGSLSLAGDASNSATVRELEQTYSTQLETDANVYVGPTATVTTVSKLGGQLEFNDTPSSMTVTTIENHAGVITFNGAGEVTNMNLYGGITRYHSVGTVDSIMITGGATLDFSRDLSTKTVANPIERHSDQSRILDPFKTVSGLIIDNNQVSDLSNLDLGSDFRITRGATA